MQNTLLVSEVDHERIEQLRREGYRYAAIVKGAFNEDGATIDGFFMARRVQDSTPTDDSEPISIRSTGSVNLPEPRATIVSK